MKWHATLVLMPDDQIYVGITEDNYGDGITISEYDTQEEADDFCGAYAAEHNLPTFADYKEV